ncbi:SdrD B-like domain-containing protein, partial [Yoonia sp. 2307UL14-13]|uniref:SdrD B-like domain-containing protein n=1 Tax=Yoonia sp. 2307UL14-13 TaxID=3126506 RepID=UPI0030962EDA
LVDQDAGDDDAVDSDADPATGLTAPITVVAGETTEDVDAGLTDPGTASLGGRVFVDSDKNDLEDDDETGVTGATVQLLLAGAIVATTTTDAQGNYLFEDLDAGDYQVVFTNPGDLAFVAPNVGGDDGIDSDATDNGDGTATTTPISVGSGDDIRDVDAGLADPGTAAIGDTVFIDENGNGVFDDGEATRAGVGVTLFDEDGTEIATTSTDAAGNYLFDGLDAGTYSIGFDAVDGFDFTTANTGDDGADSDVDPATGRTGDVTLDVGETDLTVDAGLVAQNVNPVAVDDMGMVCALETTNIDVLANDSDADGGTVALATVNGVALSVGASTTLDSGAVVTLNADGTLAYDSTNAVIDGVAAADMPIGSTFDDSFAYTITDGQGGVDDGTVNVEVKGALNTIDTIAATLPAEAVTIQGAFLLNLGYSATINGTGDDRLDGIRVENAYCIERTEKFIPNIDVDMDVYAGTESAIDDGQFTNNLVENLDAINWLLNQDFTSQSNGDTTGPTAGRNYTEVEIQHVIWGLTDGNAELKLDTFVGDFYNGTQENIDELLGRALAEGEGYEPGEGDLITIILDPEEVQAGFSEEDDYDQAFILTYEFDAFMQDPIC